jgi:hypothetical protein
MRDYTYLDAGRFGITNIYRTKRFDIDRLDLNWSSGYDNRDFVRGFRIVDHDDGNRVYVHGADADDLIFSMAHINNQENSGEKDFEAYILEVLESKKYLVANQKNTVDQVKEMLH